jgi:hypothetical protein
MISARPFLTFTTLGTSHSWLLTKDAGPARRAGSATERRKDGHEVRRAISLHE